MLLTREKESKIRTNFKKSNNLPPPTSDHNKKKGIAVGTNLLHVSEVEQLFVQFENHMKLSEQIKMKQFNKKISRTIANDYIKKTVVAEHYLP